MISAKVDLKKGPTEVGSKGELLSFVFKDLKVFEFLSLKMMVSEEQ